MSCCPPAPAIIRGDSPDPVSGIADTPMLPGESTECYMATANNPTNRHDDATANVGNKIETPTIPLKPDGTVDVTFKMQEYSGADRRVPTSWEIKDDAGARPSWYHPAANNEPSKPPAWNNNNPVRVENDNFNSGATLRLFGQFRISDFGKSYRIIVSAKDAQGVIDSRGYVFSAEASAEEDNIRFVHPLPGAIVTSRFNPQRKHPVTGIVKPHNGADFALPGRAIGDILAAADGEVIFTGYEAKGAGNYTKIKHVNSAGKHMCTTVYMHQAQIYVKVGQKVSAGQKIGLEGNTGIGTGAHLHFECRLPNNMYVDPEPLIKGTVKIAQETNPDNTAKEGTIVDKKDNAALTPSNVDAKMSGCVPNGPAYPTPAMPDAATVVAPPAAPPTTDPFELAWALTMDTEIVGWEGTPPTRPTTIAGVIVGANAAETKTLKRRVGFVDHPADPGGVTKFGIAQKFNKGKVVEDITYADAKNAGYSKYWKGQLCEKTATAGKPKASIAIFNFGFLCGNGGVQSIVNSANIAPRTDSDAVDAICDAAKAYLLQKVEEKPSKAVFRQGWMNRVEKVRSFAKSAKV